MDFPWGGAGGGVNRDVLCTMYYILCLILDFNHASVMYFSKALGFAFHLGYPCRFRGLWCWGLGEWSIRDWRIGRLGDWGIGRMGA